MVGSPSNVNVMSDITASPATDSTNEGQSSRDRLLESTSDQQLPGYGSLNNEQDAHRDELDNMEQLELEERAKRPFYRRPSPWWVIVTIAVGSTIISVSLAPRIDLYTSLVCEHLKPEITSSSNVISTTSWKNFPIPSTECVQDPQVQAAVAALQTAITASSGFLGCLTVGWWGQFSDRYGRIAVLVLSSGGLLITDANLLLVTQASDWLPGGYNFLLVGAVLGGIFGGIPTFMAVVASYIADTSPPELRARNLSLKSGLLLSGISFGPSLGSYIVKRTNNLLSVFYIAFITHLVLVLIMPLVIPESLTKASMLKARRRREELKARNSASQDTGKRNIYSTLAFYLYKIFAFARPMSILLPHKRSDGKGWDYNLFLVAITMSLNMLTMGVYTFMIQFLQRVFGWNSTQSGYWFTVVLITKAACLIVVIPLIIQIFKPKPPQPIKLPEGDESLVGEQEELLIENTPSHRSPSLPRVTHHTASFDYKLTAFALIMEAINYSCMTLARTPVEFTIACMIGGLAAGFTPAIKSVALSLYEQGPYEGAEVGRLFGALGIVEALSGSVLGPLLLGSVFIKTVGIFPQAIYTVALGAVVIGAVFFSLIRLRVTSSNPRSSERA